jgi:glycerophosphoryl diester phosphodiesterase
MLVLAHRGLHHSQPENSLAAFAAAVELKLDGIETDVRISRDGLPLLIHDRVLNKDRPVTDLTRKEAEALVRHPVPTLDEALDAFAGILWNIEIKTPNALPAALKILGHYQKTRQLLVSSFRHDVVLRCAEALDVECALLSAQRPARLREFLGAIGSRHKIRTLIWDYNIFDEALLHEAAACGWRSWVYGAITRAEHRHCASLELAGLITDHPQYLQK